MWKVCEIGMRETQGKTEGERERKVSEGDREREKERV